MVTRQHWCMKCNARTPAVWEVKVYDPWYGDDILYLCERHMTAYREDTVLDFEAREL